MCIMARYLLLLVASAAILGAAVGLSGSASAATTDVHQPNIVAAPTVKAHPAPDAQPGWNWHHGVHHLADLQPNNSR
jgi:hypothetical protein